MRAPSQKRRGSAEFWFVTVLDGPVVGPGVLSEADEENGVVEGVLVAEVGIVDAFSVELESLRVEHDGERTEFGEALRHDDLVARDRLPARERDREARPRRAPAALKSRGVCAVMMEALCRDKRKRGGALDRAQHHIGSSTQRT